MSYVVKEVFYTLQGEGLHAGRGAVFLRFSGCNLWSGREEDRATATCRFCDTDFIGGERFDHAASLALRAQHEWGGRQGQRYVVVTGGEPGLQLDATLVSELRALGFKVAVETNGTRPLPAVDWLTVSPKAHTEVVIRSGDELKVIVPQPDLDLVPLETWDFRYHFVQPMDGQEGSLATAMVWCLARPRWRLSLQMHKVVGLR